MLTELRNLSIRALQKMYLPETLQFVFRVRKDGNKVKPEGVSRRYTAITAIGLAGEKAAAQEKVLGKHTLGDLCAGLSQGIAANDNLGDVSLALWAARDCGYSDLRAIREKLILLQPSKPGHATVETAWALDAMCRDLDGPFDALRFEVARALKAAFNKDSSVFPHVIGNRSGMMRSHVSCFADMVYPIHALANYFRLTGDQEALEIASGCADRICQLQGPEGQWWWHYDYRTGAITEGYPVYSVHQDAMAPMALFALQDAGGGDYSQYIRKGLDWLAFSREINGTLVDEAAGVIWRKVARREPGKAVRYLQAFASRLHPDWRLPAMDSLFPPGAVDYECRPYHLAWLLYAWPDQRVKEFSYQPPLEC